MVGVSDQNAMFHALQVLPINDIDVAPDCEKDIARCDIFDAQQHLLAVHDGFLRVHRNDHVDAHVMYA